MTFLVLGQDATARPVFLVAGLALVSLLPFLFMGATAFIKISTVLQIVKSAIGAQSVPSNTVVMTLAAALTLVAMAPVGDRIGKGVAPLFERNVDTPTMIREGIAAVSEPMREFFVKNASAQEKARFLRSARQVRPETERDHVAEKDFTVLLPAFVVTELSEAFKMGFLLYLPFLVIDLVIANVLLALGMQMLSPTQVSLPFKLLLFASIDGWGLLAQSLIQGYS